jgi:hypothetical protein
MMSASRDHLELTTCFSVFFSHLRDAACGHHARGWRGGLAFAHPSRSAQPLIPPRHGANLQAARGDT